MLNPITGSVSRGSARDGCGSRRTAREAHEATTDPARCRRVPHVQQLTIVAGNNDRSSLISKDLTAFLGSVGVVSRADATFVLYLQLRELYSNIFVFEERHYPDATSVYPGADRQGFATLAV